MQINLTNSTAKYQIKKYAPGRITVNDQEYTQSILIMPEYLAPWPVLNLGSITKEHITELCNLKPALILFSTGQEQAFLPTEILAPALQHNIGIEFMTTAAACRTYTILVSEHINVLAALLI